MDTAIKLKFEYDRETFYQARLEALDWLVTATPTDAGFPGEAHRGWQAGLVYDPYGVAGSIKAVDRLDALRRLVASMGFPVLMARLMVLNAGGRIGRHQDRFIGFEEGLLRLHLPLATSEGAALEVDGVQYSWPVGDLWYADFSKPHSGYNDSGEARVHLVLDVPVSSSILSSDGVSLVGHGHANAISYPADVAVIRRFLVPAGIEVPSYTVLDRAHDGAVLRIGSRYVLYINGTPFLDARRLARDRFTLEISGQNITIEFSGHEGGFDPEPRITMTSSQ